MNTEAMTDERLADIRSDVDDQAFTANASDIMRELLDEIDRMRACKAQDTPPSLPLRAWSPA